MATRLFAFLWQNLFRIYLIRTEIQSWSSESGFGVLSTRPILDKSLWTYVRKETHKSICFQVIYLYIHFYIDKSVQSSDIIMKYSTKYTTVMFYWYKITFYFPYQRTIFDKVQVICADSVLRYHSIQNRPNRPTLKLDLILIPKADKKRNRGILNL